MGALVFVLIWVVVALGAIAAWVTHVVACIAAGAWILLLIGCFIAPIGVIHGIMLWCGMGWVPV